MESPSDQPSAQAAADPTTSAASALQRIKLPLWLFLLLLVLLLVSFGWGRFAASTAERRLASERQTMTEAFDAERAALQKASNEAIARQTAELESLFGAALAWSVRSSMLRNNLDEIDQYFGVLVRNPRIPLVLLVGAEGQILRSSDRQFVDSDFAAHFPAELLTGSDVAVHPDEGRRRRIVMPIQGLTARLGTVLLIYSPLD